MLFSLVVATYARHDTLRAFLESLKEQSYRNFEVILIDQNPPGFLDELCREYSGYFPLSALPTTVRNASEARNLGLSKTCGDIISFPDDDCRYAPNALERVATLFAGDTNLGGLLVSWAETLPGNPRQGKTTIVSRLNSFRRAGTLVQFYRKKSIQDVYFDPDLGPGEGSIYSSGEDTDFLLQVLDKGVSVQRLHETLVLHPEPDMHDPLLAKKTRSYAFGRMKLLQKHNFPLWFQLANICYPLLCLPRAFGKAGKYRFAMFWGRLQGFLR